MRRLDQRQGFLVSAAVHLTLLMILIAHPIAPRGPERIDPSTLERKSLVFLPAPSVLRQMVPMRRQTRRPIAPHQVLPPLPMPPPEAATSRKDRVSVGSPGQQAKGPVLLKRDEDLTSMAARGQPGAVPIPAPSARSSRQTVEKAEARAERPGLQGVQLPPSLLGRGVAGGEGQRGVTGSTRPEGSSFDRAAEAAIDEVTRRMQRDAQLGVRTGAGQNMGGLSFDPQGADFTLWVNQFKNEVYRNWIVPQSVLLGFRGHVDFEFTVERNGSISSLRMLKSSGTSSLDRAAQNALTSSRLAALPDDYGPPRVTMQVTFFYNEGPRGS